MAGVPQWIWTLGVGVILAGASFFFALAEASLFGLSRWQLHLIREQSPRHSRALQSLLDKPRDLLGSIVLGNTFSNAGLIGVTLWTAFSLGWPLQFKVIAILGLFAVTLVGCEVIPKTMGIRAPEQWSLRIVRPMTLVHRMLGPAQRGAQNFNALLIRLVARQSSTPQAILSDDEYRELVEIAYQEGTIAKSEKEIIHEIIALDRHTAGDVMKPRAQMACISDELSKEDMIAAARKYRHRRLPIYDEDADTIVGVLNTRALLLNPEGDIEDAIEFPSFVPESMNLVQLLRSLQRQQRGIAIVLDEYGGTAGLVTVEDILEEMIGELREEGEEQGFVIERLAPGKWRVNGTMRLEDFCREYPQLGEVPEVDTMAGLLISRLGVVPNVGASVVFRGLKLEASAGDQRRVRELLVQVVPKKGGNKNV